MDNGIKYLENGQQIEVLQKLETGYLVSDIYEYVDEEFISEGKPYFVAKVYDNAPTVKLDEKIKTKYATIEKLESRISELIWQKDNQEILINQIAKTPNLQTIANCIGSDGVWLELGSLKIYPVNYERNITFRIIKGALKIYITNDYGSEEKQAIWNRDNAEALDKRIEIFIDKIISTQRYHNLGNLGKEYIYKDLLSQPEIKKVYDEKLAELKTSDMELAAKEGKEKLLKIVEQLRELNVDINEVLKESSK